MEFQYIEMGKKQNMELYDEMEAQREKEAH